MIRISSIKAVLSTLVQPQGSDAAGAQPAATNGSARATATGSAGAGGSTAANSAANSAAASISTASDAQPTHEDTGANGAAGSKSPAAASSHSAQASPAASVKHSVPHHPHTALVILAQSGQVYASASTYTSPSTSSRASSARASSSASRPARSPHADGLFVTHPPPQDKDASIAKLAAGGDAETNAMDHAHVMRSLEGEERTRVLAGLATLHWRNQLMSDSPVIPYVFTSELGLILVQPLGPGSPLSAPNSPPPPDDAPHGPSSSAGDEGSLFLAQRRRAFSFRSTRLLLVLNSAAEPRLHLAPPSPAVRNPETEEGGQAPEAVAVPAETQGAATTTTTDDADLALEYEALVSVASACAQFLSPTLAAIS